jgi:hypothetical protein
MFDHTGRIVSLTMYDILVCSPMVGGYCCTQVEAFTGGLVN